MSSTTRKLALGAVVRVVGMIASVITAFLLMPFIVRHIGDRLYGIWSLVSSFVAYSTLLDLGLTNAVNRHLSRVIGAQQPEEGTRIFNTALRLYLSVCVLLLLIGGGLAVVTPWFARTAEDIALLRKLILIFAVNGALFFCARVFVGALYAQLRYDRIAALDLLTVVLRSVGMVLALLWGYSIVGLAVASLLGMLPSVCLDIYFAHHDIPFIRLRRRMADRAIVKTLFSYSLFAMLATSADLLRFQFDGLVVAATVGVAAVTHYRVAGSMTLYFMDLVTATMGYLPALFSRQEGQRNYKGMQESFYFANKISLSVVGFIGFGLIAWGKPFITRWMGPRYLDAYPCLVVLVAGCVCSLWQLPSVSLLYGVSRHKVYALLNWIEGAANLGLSILLARRYGIVGVALGTAIPMICIKLLVQPVYVCRVAEISYPEYVRRICRHVGVIALSLLAPYLVTRFLVAPDYASLALTGILCALAYLPMQWFVMFNAQERGILMAAALPRARVAVS